jgi:hypothetical protein
MKKMPKLQFLRLLVRNLKNGVAAFHTSPKEPGKIIAGKEHLILELDQGKSIFSTSCLHNHNLD